MAFNWQIFKTRTLTAAIFVVVMLAGLLINHWTFLILFSLIHFGCWWEYLKLLERIHKKRFHYYLKFGLMLIGYGLMIGFCNEGYRIGFYDVKENFALPISVAGFALLIIGIFQKPKTTIRSFAATCVGLLYISLTWGLMMDLTNGTKYDPRDVTRFAAIVSIYFLPYLPILIIVSIWINDTMAYIVGSLIGKTQMSRISPKKTWEGTIGGIILSILVVGLLAPIFLLRDEAHLQRHLGFLIAAIASVAGTVGDLLESKLKRMAGAKDSGHIMPGHGGFLDRFDSLLLATPMVWLYVYFFMH